MTGARTGASIGLVGGMDPSGGAGLLRDDAVARHRAPGLEVRAVCTALTRQGHGAPAIQRPSELGVLGRELEQLAGQPQLRAVKLGMIPREAVEIVDHFLVALRARPDPPRVVLDPVMWASDGGRLGAPAQQICELAWRVDLITPNLSELEQLERAGLARIAPATAALIKGEPLPAGRIRARLRTPVGPGVVIERPRVDGPDPRGTGCALATAIACELARGRSLATAVVASIAWLDGARRRTHPGPDGRAMLSALERRPV